MMADQRPLKYVEPAPKRVLLIPGLPFFRWAPSPDWRAIEAEIRNRRNGDPVLVDLPGWMKWAAVPFPWLRNLLVRRLLGLVGFKKGDRPSVIAHSFGTVILARALRMESDFSLDDVLLLGAALHTKFPWDEYRNTDRVRKYRNLYGKKDWIIRLCFRFERFKARFRCRGDLGGSGFYGLRCCQGDPCSKHNEGFELDDHFLRLNPVGMSKSLNFLALCPVHGSLEGNPSQIVFQRKRRVPRGLSDHLCSVMRRNTAVFIEGAMGAGKSSAVVLALEKLKDSHDASCHYYLNAGSLQNLPQIKRDIAELSDDTILVFDDMHRDPERAVEIGSYALLNYRGKLVLVSRCSTLDGYLSLREEFNQPGEGVMRAIFVIPGRDSGETGEIEFSDFIGNALRVYDKNASTETVAKFYDFYRHDVTELFDAIEEWTHPEPITRELADRRLRKRLNSDRDLEIDGARDPALAAYLAVAAFWQFETPVGLDYLTHIIGLDRNVPQTLAKRGILQEFGESSRPEYRLDHESRARRSITVARKDFTLPLQFVRAFDAKAIRRASDGSRVTAHLLLLEVLASADAAEQVRKLEEFNARMLLSSYAYDYLELTEVFRDNLNLLEPMAQVEILVQGGAFRRRKGEPAAEVWLDNAMALHGATSGSGALGKILYEQAYLLYNKNEFTEAASKFRESANASDRKIGKLMSEAKAVAADFQASISGDFFSINLVPRTAEPVVRTTLDEINERTRFSLEQFTITIDGASGDDRSNVRTLSHARQWRVKCLQSLAEVCIEQENLIDARRLLQEASEHAREIRYYAIRPLQNYLEGRLALLEGNPGKAIDLVRRAYEDYDQYGEEGRGDLLITLGDAYLAMGHRQKAHDTYERCTEVNVRLRNLRAVNSARQRLDRPPTN